MHEAGLDADRLYSAGWINVDETNNTIPNYFSPFRQENIDVYYCSSDKEAVLFRGDGDQDRPN